MRGSAAAYRIKPAAYGSARCTLTNLLYIMGTTRWLRYPRFVLTVNLRVLDRIRLHSELDGGLLPIIGNPGHRRLIFNYLNITHLYKFVKPFGVCSGLRVGAS